MEYSSRKCPCDNIYGHTYIERNSRRPKNVIWFISTLNIVQWCRRRRFIMLCRRDTGRSRAYTEITRIILYNTRFVGKSAVIKWFKIFSNTRNGFVWFMRQGGLIFLFFCYLEIGFHVKTIWFVVHVFK